MSAFVYLADQDDIFRTLDMDVDVGFSPGFSGTGFEPANLQTSDITKLWRSSPMAGDPGGYIISIDLGVGVTWDFVAWINHDFPESATVELKSGTTGSVLDHTDEIPWREFDMYFRAAAPRTDRYIQIRLQNDDDFQVSAGRLLVGLATVSAVPPTYGWSIAPVTKAADNRSAFNVKNVDVFCQYHQLRFPFMNKIGNAAAVTFITFLKSLQGMKNWFFLIPDSTEYDGYAVRLMSQPRRIRSQRNDFDDVFVEEESRGVRIPA